MRAVQNPETSSTDRRPTPREVVQVLQGIAGYEATITANRDSGEWHATIQSCDPGNPSWTALRISDYRDDDSPHDLCFHKGFPEVVLLVVERLTRFCGPLVVVNDSGSSPTVVRPGDSVPDLLRQNEEL
jgi:hypothetical protein